MAEVGIGAALAGGIANALAYTIQRKALEDEPRKYVCRATWWLGIGILLVAEALGGLAYAYIPAATVVALESVSLVANSAIVVWRGARCDVHLVVGTSYILWGAIVLSLASPHVQLPPDTASFERLLYSNQSLAYYAIAFALGGVLHCVAFVRNESLIGLALYASIVSSVTVMWFRPLMTFALNGTLWSAPISFTLPALFIVLITGGWSAAVVEPRGLATYCPSQWVPVHFVSCLVTFGIAGQLVYGDWQYVHSPAALAAALIILVTFPVAVWLVVTRYSIAEPQSGCPAPLATARTRNATWQTSDQSVTASRPCARK